MLFYSLTNLILNCQQVQSFRSHPCFSLSQVFFGDQVLLLEYIRGRVEENSLFLASLVVWLTGRATWSRAFSPFLSNSEHARSHTH